jgi:hypothetical protein
MRAFGLTVIAADPYRTDWPEWVRRVPLEELLQAADIVSLHCPLTDETRHLISATTLRKMKPTAILVNTSRGGVVDTEAILQALRQPWIAGAALDVQEAEPMPAAHPLAGLDNVILTPHAAWYLRIPSGAAQDRAGGSPRAGRPSPGRRGQPGGPQAIAVGGGPVNGCPVGLTTTGGGDAEAHTGKPRLHDHPRPRSRKREDYHEAEYSIRGDRGDGRRPLGGGRRSGDRPGQDPVPDLALE